jgi:MFS family permease
MTPQAATRPKALSGMAWLVLVLLAVSGFLNYFDRSNLAVGATDIQRDLHLSNTDLGLLQSAFFWLYAAMQFLGIAGWLVDRFNVCWILAAGFLIWSGATALTGIAHTFSFIFSMRLLLGIGESIAYPAYSRILANHYPNHRGIANATIDFGTKMGPALGTLLGGLLMLRYGWRPFFIGLGFGSFLWLMPWGVWMPRGMGVGAREDPAGIPSTYAILRKREAWFTAFGLFCSNYFWYFLITWLPHYMETERKFAKAKMTWLATLAYLLIGVSSITSGWFSDWLISRGHTPNRVRKTLSAIGLTLATTIVGVVVFPGDAAAMTFLMISCFCFGIYAPQIYAMTQTLAGPRASGKWTGLQNGFGNLAGVTAPWVTGWITDHTGHFYWAFVATACVVVSGALFWCIGVKRIEPVQW